MIVFELTMPNVGSWNGHWSGERDHYVKCVDERTVPKPLWGKSFIYNFGDGWTAKVSTKQLPAKEARKIKSNGFCGYDWMVESIVRYGCIVCKSDWSEMQKLERSKEND